VLAHYTAVNNDAALGSSSGGFAGRGGIFALRWLEAEIEYGRASAKVRGPEYTDGAWFPTRLFATANLPLRPRAKLLIGAGLVDTYKGDVTNSPFEEGVSVLAGVRICFGDAWSLRPEIVWDRTPDPASWLQRDYLAASNGQVSTRWNFRIGVSRFLGRGSKTCAEGAPAPAAPKQPAPRPAPVVTPPPVAPPVAAPPPPAPTASISASPARITSGQSATLTWSSTNATRCTAPWMTGNAASGSQSVSPTSNTTYNLTCNGAGGSGNASTSVNVTQPAPPPVVAPPAAAPPPRVAPPREIFKLQGVFFDFDKATLTPAGQKQLDSAVTILTRLSDVNVEIQGHTDSLGPAAYNQSLSERRAQSVKEYLTSKGVPASRLTAKGYGESQPAADNGTKAGRAENRRVLLVEIRK